MGSGPGPAEDEPKAGEDQEQRPHDVTVKPVEEADIAQQEVDPKHDQEQWQEVLAAPHAHAMDSDTNKRPGQAALKLGDIPRRGPPSSTAPVPPPPALP